MGAPVDPAPLSQSQTIPDAIPIRDDGGGNLEKAHRMSQQLHTLWNQDNDVDMIEQGIYSIPEEQDDENERETATQYSQSLSRRQSQLGQAQSQALTQSAHVLHPAHPSQRHSATYVDHDPSHFETQSQWTEPTVMPVDEPRQQLPETPSAPPAAEPAEVPVPKKPTAK